EQVSVWFDQGELVCADKSARLLGERTVNRNEVAKAKQFGKVNQARSSRGGSFRFKKWIEGEWLIHAKATQQVDCLARNSPQANNAQRTFAQFAPHILGTPIPLARPNQAVFD